MVKLRRDLQYNRVAEKMHAAPVATIAVVDLEIRSSARWRALPPSR